MKRSRPTRTSSCRDGDHDLCLQSVLAAAAQNRDSIDRVCGCRCHKTSAALVNHRPTTRDARVTSRQRSWNTHWYYSVFPSPVIEKKDESIIRPPKDPKDILYGR